MYLQHTSLFSEYAATVAISTTQKAVFSACISRGFASISSSGRKLYSSTRLTLLNVISLSSSSVRWVLEGLNNGSFSKVFHIYFCTRFITQCILYTFCLNSIMSLPITASCISLTLNVALVL